MTHSARQHKHNLTAIVHEIIIRNCHRSMSRTNSILAKKKSEDVETIPKERFKFSTIIGLSLQMVLVYLTTNQCSLEPWSASMIRKTLQRTAVHRYMLGWSRIVSREPNSIHLKHALQVIVLEERLMDLFSCSETVLSLVRIRRRCVYFMWSVLHHD